MDGSWIKSFKSPSRSFYPCVMWFWNDEISETEIEYQILKFKEQLIFEFFVHPMFGFEEEYLGKRFFKLIGRCVDVAEREGMKFWIYDEYNWPSGTAGGNVLRDFPKYRCSSLLHVKLEAKKGRAVEYKPEFEFEKILSATLIVKSDAGEKAIDVTEQISVSDDGFLLYAQPEADGELVINFKQIIKYINETVKWSKFSKYEEGYVDLTNPAAVKDFIYHTHEKYKKYLGDHFGKTILGVFTDEPAISAVRDSSLGALPWTDAFYRFSERYGYDIIPKLYLLERNSEEPEVLEVKRDFWDYYCRLFERNYIVQLEEWCHENGLLLTGHYVGEEYMLLNMELFGGGFYEGLRHFDYPGIDTIFSNIYINNDRFNAAGSMIGSLAHFEGKSRVLCETFSASGWDMTVPGMKRIINRLMLFGVSYLMYMGAYYTIKGWRKVPTGCYPPSHSWHNPQFGYYGILNREIAAMSVLNASTVQTGKTLILHPSTAASMTFEARYDYNWLFDINYNDRGTFTREDASYTGAVNAHLELKRSFETGFETALLTACVRDGKLILADNEYSVVFLPAARYIKANTASLLKLFAEGGGKIIYLNDVPRAEAETLNELDWVQASEEDLQAVEELRTRKKEFFTEVRKLGENQYLILSNENSYSRLKNLSKAIEDCYGILGISEDIAVSGEKVFVGFRNNDYGSFHTIINDEDREKNVRVKLKKARRSMLLDPSDSTVIGEYYTDEINIALEGCGCLVLFVSGSEVSAGEVISYLSMKTSDRTEDGLEQENIPIQLEFKPSNKNYLRLEYQMVNDRETEKIYESKLYRTDPEEFFRTVAEMDSSLFRDSTDSGLITYGPTASNQKVYPILSAGDRYFARLTFRADQIPGDLALVTEKLFNEKVFLNGQEVKFKRMRLWDKDNLVAGIAQMCRTGENTIVTTGRAPYWVCPHTPPFMALAGRFSLDGQETVTEYCPAPLGQPINKNGFRYYFGEYSYEGSFNIDKIGARRFIEVDSDEVVGVFVNDRFISYLMTAPRRVEITDFLRKGKNRLKLTARTKLTGIFEGDTDSGIYSVRILKESGAKERRS